MLMSRRIAQHVNRHTPQDIVEQNNREQTRQLIEASGADTTRELVRDLRKRIERDQTALREAELQLAILEGREP